MTGSFFVLGRNLRQPHEAGAKLIVRPLQLERAERLWVHVRHQGNTRAQKPERIVRVILGEKRTSPVTRKARPTHILSEVVSRVWWCRGRSRSREGAVGVRGSGCRGREEAFTKECACSTLLR